MTKHEFLAALGEGLAQVSPEERAAAMQYYTEYLDEAGPDRLDEVLAELGDPKRIATGIIASSGAITAAGWTPPPRPGQDAPPKGPAGTPPPAPHAPKPPPGAGQPPSPGYNTHNSNTAKVILLVLALIILLPLLGGLGGALVGLLAALFVLFLCPIIIGVSFFAAGIGCIISGGILTSLAVGPGLLVLGAGVFLLGLSGLLCYAGGRLLGEVLPSAVRGTVNAVRSLFIKIKDMLAETEE